MPTGTGQVGKFAMHGIGLRNASTLIGLYLKNLTIVKFVSHFLRNFIDYKENYPEIFKLVRHRPTCIMHNPKVKIASN